MATKRDNLYSEPYNRLQVVGDIIVNSTFVIPTPRNVFITDSIPYSIEHEYRMFLKKVKDKNGE